MDSCPSAPPAQAAFLRPKEMRLSPEKKTAPDGLHAVFGRQPSQKGMDSAQIRSVCLYDMLIPAK